jgi:short-chain Z-isoprenyl diphosphate synthase
LIDGNRRYGRSRGLHDPDEIYRRGADKLDDVLRWCSELRIATVTVWVLSTDNLKRSSSEISAILGAIEGKIAALGRDVGSSSHGIRVRAIGKLDALPRSLLAAIHATEQATAAHETMTLNLAVGYGGREEIADAVRALLRDEAARGATTLEIIEKVAPHAIERYLYTAGLPAPDLIVRTSGELRLSGFLLWQSVHAEFYFTDVPWPALRKVDFLRAIRSYQQRDRRFGQ